MRISIINLLANFMIHKLKYKTLQMHWLDFLMGLALYVIMREVTITDYFVQPAVLAVSPLTV